MVVRAGTKPVRKSASFVSDTSMRRAIRPVSAGSAADTSQKADDNPTPSRPMAGMRIRLRMGKLVNPSKSSGRKRMKRSAPRDRHHQLRGTARFNLHGL